MSMIDCATKLTSVYCDVLKKNGVTHVGRYLPTTDWKGLSFGRSRSDQRSWIKPHFHL
jgi:hypothetical protein